MPTLSGGDYNLNPNPKRKRKGVGGRERKVWALAENSSYAKRASKSKMAFVLLADSVELGSCPILTYVYQARDFKQKLSYKDNFNP